MSSVLAAVAELDAGLIFRGGTALARVYWPDFRLSEDLDFITRRPGSDVENSLSRAVRTASQLASVELQFDFGRAKRGWSRSAVRFDGSTILVDVNFNETSYLAVENRRLDLPYSDLLDIPRSIPVVPLPEILGNKWFMLGETDRREPRDLYDVWAGLETFDVPFNELVRGHRAKYGFAPMEAQLKEALLVESLWETRLAHQLAALPTFGDVYEAVRSHYVRWRNASRTKD